MNAKRTLTVVGLGLLAVACNRPGEDVQRKQESQQEQLTQAQMEGKSERKVDEANKDLNKSVMTFDRTRDDYRTSREKDLADIDRRINDLEAKNKTATGKTKAQLGAQLPTIHQDRDAFAGKLRQLDTANATNFDGLKADIDASYDELKAAVRKAE